MRCKMTVGGSIGRLAAALALTFGLAFTGLSVEAAESPAGYPTKPIRMVCTNSPGSGSDIMARLVAQKLTDGLGQQVIVDNRPGGGGNVGGEIVAKATPDGYTLMLVTSSNAISTALFKKLTYDLLNDFSPVILLGTAPYILVVTPSLAAKSVQELIALDKSKPGQLYYGSSGNGTGVHLAAETFKSMSGTKFVHVPYRGLSPALTDLMGGQIQMAFAVATAALPIIKTGRVRALGVSSRDRTALAPDLPAISETVPGYEAIGWYGVLAPKGTPGEIISKLNGALTKVAKTSEWQQKLLTRGVTSSSATMPREFEAFMKTQIKGFREAVRDSGMKVE